MQHHLKLLVLFRLLKAFSVRLMGLIATFFGFENIHTDRFAAMLHLLPSEYFAKTSLNFTINKNINFAVADSPHANNYVHKFYTTMMPIESTKRICSPGDSYCMKRKILHEKPNYHTRFGQTKSNCPPGKWGAGTALHRV